MKYPLQMKVLTKHTKHSLLEHFQGVGLGMMMYKVKDRTPFLIIYKNGSLVMVRGTQLAPILDEHILDFVHGRDRFDIMYIMLHSS